MRGVVKGLGVPSHRLCNVIMLVCVANVKAENEEGWGAPRSGGFGGVGRIAEVGG